MTNEWGARGSIGSVRFEFETYRNQPNTLLDKHISH